MILAHAITLAESRSYLAALARHARTFEGSLEYGRVLLQLDWTYDDNVPALEVLPLADLNLLFYLAQSSLESLTSFGADPLRIELLLDMLRAARERDNADEPNDPAS